VTRWIQRLAILLVIPVLFAGVHAMIRPMPGGFMKLGPAASAPVALSEEDFTAKVEQLRELFESGAAFFIDARTRRDFLAGHLEGSIHLPFEAFLAAGRPPVLDMLPTDLHLVIYCAGGDCDASHKVAEMLGSFGYTHLEIFDPGWPALRDSGLPLAEGEGMWQ
jgi:rhodanese-related sulfurtransferase